MGYSLVHLVEAIGGAYFSDVTGSIKDMIECPNNWGVGSVFPTLENTYFLTKSPIAGSEPNMENCLFYGEVKCDGRQVL